MLFSIITFFAYSSSSLFLFTRVFLSILHGSVPVIGLVALDAAHKQ
jgi:hypothetical protein